MSGKPIEKNDNQDYIYDDDSALTTQFHASRTAETHASWFLPYLKPGMTLLDCGCASASITVGLTEAVNPGQVTGVDISEVEIQRAKQRATENKISNIDFKVGNIQHLDFPDNSLDAVFSHNVLEHIPEPEKALQDMKRVLKPGGIIGIGDIDWGGHLIAPDNELLKKLHVVYETYWENEGGHPRIGRELGRLFHKAGIVDAKTSASYEVWSDKESCRYAAKLWISVLSEDVFVEKVTQSGLAEVEELEGMKDAWKMWKDVPGAFYARPHVEVVGRKPSE